MAAIDVSKALHARRWQTKDGTYRLKKHVLPDVRDGRDIYDDAGASASDAIPHFQDWDDDAMANFFWRGAGHLVSIHYLVEFEM